MRFILLAIAFAVLFVAANAAAIEGTEEIVAPPGQTMTAPSQSANFSDQYRISDNFNNALFRLPSFTRSAIGDERVIFDVSMQNGSSLEYGAISQGGYITRVQPTPYPDSTVRVSTDEGTIDGILNSSDPYTSFRNDWGSSIKVEGLGIIPSLKLFLVNLVMGIYFFFTPSSAAQPRATSQLTINLTNDNLDMGIDDNPIDCSPLSGGPGGTPVTWSPDDRARFTNVTDNISLLQQPNRSTCSPTAGAIDLLHWNATIAPGLVNVNQSALINEMARRMNTTGNGTVPGNIAKGIAGYFADHNASANFTVKIYYPARREKTNVSDNVTNVFTIELYNDLQYEFFSGENLIVDVRYEDGMYHSMKLIAMQRNADSNGEHLVAFADPATGNVVFGGLDESGNLYISGKSNAKVVSFVAVSPRK